MKVTRDVAKACVWQQAGSQDEALFNTSVGVLVLGMAQNCARARDAIRVPLCAAQLDLRKAMQQVVNGLESSSI